MVDTLGKKISKLEELIHKATVLLDDAAIKESYQMIRSGMDLNALDEEGRSLFGFCFSNKEYVCYVPRLIKAGADLNVSDKEGKTPLMNLIESAKTILNDTNYVSLLEELIEKGADVLRVDFLGETVLHKSMDKEIDYEVVYKLLENKANVNAQNNEGLTALSLIMKNKGCGRKASILRAYGADESIKDKNGKTAFDIAKEKGTESLYLDALNLPTPKEMEEARKKIAEFKEKGVPLEMIWMRAASKGDTAFLAVLHEEEGVDVNYADPCTGKTALHEVYFSSSIEAISYLLEKKADVNKQDNKGVTPLMNVARAGGSLAWGGWGLAIFLLNNPNLNIQDNQGNTALHHVAHIVSNSGIKMLVQKGADASIKNKKGQTARDVYEKFYQMIEDTMPDYRMDFLNKWLKKAEPVLIQKGTVSSKKLIDRQKEE